MKTYSFYFLILFYSHSFMSCVSTKLTTATSKTMDIYGPGVVQQPVIAELQVKSEKITASTEASISTTSMDAMKNEAVNQAMIKSGADILVEPKFESETSRGKTIVKVTGYPAYYRNFRPMQPGDEFLLSSGILQKAKVYEPAVITQKSSKNAVGWTLGSLAVLLGVAVIAAQAQ